MTPLERAREVLGEVGRKLSDRELEEICRDMEGLARWLYDRLTEGEAQEQERRSAA